MSKTIILLVTGIMCSLSLNAQTTTQPADTLEFEELIVTASKIPTSLRKTTKPVLVIDQETISRNAGKDVAQLLSEQTGIYVNGAYSNEGKDKATYLQGASTRYTLFLIDGLPVYDPSTIGGVFDIRNLSLDAIERIEIVKGSMSTLYGSDAIAGVINIITKEAGEEEVQIDAMSSAGSYGTLKNQVGIRGSRKGGTYSIVYSREESDGISEARDSLSSTERELLGNEEFDKDGFLRNSVSVKGSINLNDNITISPRLLVNYFDGDYDDAAFTDAPNTFDSEFFNPAISVQYSTQKLTFQNEYSFAKTNRKNTAQFGGEFEGTVNNIDSYLSYSATEMLRFLAGFNYQNMEIGSNDRTSDLYSPYVTARLMDWYGLNAEAGLRLNNHNEYGSNMTASASASYLFANNFKILSSFGTGFKAPTLDELYGPFGANPDLDPEKSTYFNVGGEMNFRETGLNFTVNYFIRSITNVIIYGIQGYINQDEQQDQGVEIFTSYSILPQVKLNASFDYLNGSSVFNGQETDNLLRRPKTKVVLGTTLVPFSDLQLTVQGSYIGERDDIYFKPDFSSEIVTLDEVFVLNAYASYKIFQNQLTVFADVNNILNEDYEEVYGYNTLGFNFQAGFKVNLSR